MQPRVTARPAGAHVTVKLAGALDASAVAELRAFVAEALEQGWVHLVIDLTDAESVDAAIETDEVLDDFARQTHHLGGCCHRVPPEEVTGPGEPLSPCLAGETAVTELSPMPPRGVTAPTVDQGFQQSALEVSTPRFEVAIRGSPRPCA